MTSSIRWTRRIGPTLLAAAFLIASFLAGGFYESTYSLLAAGCWLGIAIGGGLVPLRRPSPAVWALLGLTGWTLLSALWGPAGPALRSAPLVVLYAGSLLAAEQVDRRLLLRLTWAVCVLVCGVALAARLGGIAPEAVGPSSQRLAWPIGYANGLALVALTGALLSLRERGRLALAGGVVCALAALLTYSRTGLLAGLAALVLLAALRGRLPRRVGLAGALVVATLAVALAQPVAARFAAPAPDGRDARRLLDVSGHGRTELWRAAWEQGLDRPLAGGGAGTWARFYVAEHDPAAAPANAHSLPLETFAELGLVGVALLAAFLWRAAHRARLDPVAAAIVAAWMISATADWTWQLPAASLPALFAASALTRREACVSETQALPLPLGEPSRSVSRGPCVSETQGLALAAVALSIGLLCALHGVGAALLEEGRPRPGLLPFDARPWVALDDPDRACRVDAGEVAIRRAHPSNEGCAR